MRIVLMATLIALLSGGCMTRAQHATQLKAVESASNNMADEYWQWAKAIAGDRNGDGRITADDSAAIPAVALPDLSRNTPQQRDAWLNARGRRRTELQETFKQAWEQIASEQEESGIPFVPGPGPGQGVSATPPSPPPQPPPVEPMPTFPPE